MGRRFKIRVASPSYQVAERFADLIRSGKLKPGEWLLPTRTLADDLGIDREIIRHAYNILKKNGLVEVIPRVGTRVAENVTTLKDEEDIPLGDAVENALNRHALLRSASADSTLVKKISSKKSRRSRSSAADSEETPDE